MTLLDDIQALLPFEQWEQENNLAGKFVAIMRFSTDMVSTEEAPRLADLLQHPDLPEDIGAFAYDIDEISRVCTVFVTSDAFDPVQQGEAVPRVGLHFAMVNDKPHMASCRHVSRGKCKHNTYGRCTQCQNTRLYRNPITGTFHDKRPGEV